MNAHRMLGRAWVAAAGLQARREARVRWRDGAAARAYIEHVFHARDLRDVPRADGLIEGSLTDSEEGGAPRDPRHVRHGARVPRRDVTVRHLRARRVAAPLGERVLQAALGIECPWRRRRRQRLRRRRQWRRRRRWWKRRRGRAVGQVAPAVRPHRRYLRLEAVVDHTLLAVGKGVGGLPEVRRGGVRDAEASKWMRRWRAARKAGGSSALA